MRHLGRYPIRTKLMLAVAITIVILASTFGSLARSAMAAEPYGTAEEAVAMVQRAVDAIKVDGADKAHAAITANDPRFKDRDLYVVSYSMTGTCLAHGQYAALVGKDLSGFKDVDGIPFIVERIELAKKNASFWQDYKFKNPQTNVVGTKSTFCEHLDSEVVCVGIYKQ